MTGAFRLCFRAGALIDALRLARGAGALFLHLSREGGKVLYRDKSYDDTRLLNIVFRGVFPDGGEGSGEEYSCMGAIYVEEALTSLNRLLKQREVGLRRGGQLIYEAGEPDLEGYSWGRVMVRMLGLYTDAYREGGRGYPSNYYTHLREAQRLREPSFRDSTGFRIEASKLLEAVREAGGDSVILEGGREGVRVVGCRFGGESWRFRRVRLGAKTEVEFSDFTYNTQLLAQFLDALNRVDGEAEAKVSATSKMVLIIESETRLGEITYMLAPLIHDFTKPTYNGIPLL
jgi:hypothetical protein